MDNRPIGVFDSGVGGLTSVRVIKEILTHEDVIYLGDNANVPYGNKSKSELWKIAKANIDFLLRFNVKAILVACGTISSTVLEELRREYDVPIVGVVIYAAKRANNLTSNHRIAAFATPMTVQSHAYKLELAKLNPDVECEEIACDGLALAIENGIIDHDQTEILSQIASLIEPAKEKGVDTIILGCTHYPIIRGAFEKMLKGVNVVDAGEAGAYRIKKQLETTNSLSNNKESGTIKYYVSGKTQQFRRIAFYLLGNEIDVISANLSAID